MVRQGAVERVTPQERRESYRRFQEKLADRFEKAVARMPEEAANELVARMRKRKGGGPYAEQFLRIRREGLARREADEAAEAFARHMAALTGRQLRPGVSLDEIARAARESGGDELAAWEAISLEPNKEEDHGA